MTVILFILVLVALIVVHEFGHFVVAKLSKMRVDEFGIGYPPRAWSKKIGETEYSLNWLPFGGFVKIYGEDEQDRVEGTDDTHRAFGSRPRILQALVLVAGIAMNLLFAWVLLSATLAFGTTRALAPEEIAGATDVQLFIADVLPGAPGQEGGLLPGDALKSASFSGNTFTSTNATDFTSFIASDTTLVPISIVVVRGDKEVALTATPRTGVIAADAKRPALGVAVATSGILPIAWWQAPKEGALLTWEVTKETAKGLYHFFASIVTFSADLSQVSGPVGIAGAVGSASSHGLIALLSLTAIISINLALINLLPLPALDGGRLLFVIIEAIIRRPLPAKFGRILNAAGFAFLILLMVVVTAHDLFKAVL
jgi:regulator of sigma E protease